MKLQTTLISGLSIIEPVVFEDERGYFFESFHARRFSEAGICHIFVQENESRSAGGVIRGLHYQIDPFAQAKLVRVIAGAVFDVAVDLRRSSPTFGKWFGIELSEHNKKQFYIPRGFAHGFSVLSDFAIFAYKCDNYYHPGSERAIRFDDPLLNIDWQIPKEKIVVSAKDMNARKFEEADYFYDYNS